MSIAGKEAREEYWNEIGLQAVMLRTAYVAGRTAEPCEEQVEAGAIALFEKQTNFSKGANHTEEDVRDAWTHMPEIHQVRFRELALSVLDAARKAVV